MRRRGFAYLQHAQKMDASQEIKLKKNLIMRNRIGAVAPSDNVYEMYFNKEAYEHSKHNYVFVGREGTGEYPNTNYIEMTANQDDSKEGAVQNGTVNMTVIEDGEFDGAIPQVSVRGGKQYGVSDGTFVLITASEGGGVYIGSAYNGEYKQTLVIDGDGGIYADLPTSDPGGTNRLWRSGNDVRIT